jgi:predicted amidohydrolase
MTVEKIFEKQTVLVEGTRIIAFGPANEVAIPEDAKVIEGAGAYLMPGLADMHMHTREDWLSGLWPVSPLKLYLANGVTTIRDFGAPERRSCSRSSKNSAREQSARFRFSKVVFILIERRVSPSNDYS